MVLARIGGLALVAVLQPLRALDGMATAGSLENARRAIEAAERKRALAEAFDLTTARPDRVA